MAHSFCATAFAAVLIASGASAANVTVKPVLSEALANVPGKAITMVRVTLPPGSSSPPHHHAGAVAVYVLRGTIRSQLGDGPLQIYTAGNTFFEPPGTHHRVSMNPSKTEPAEILAAFVADEGATLTTYDK